MKKRFWCILPALCLTLALLTATALAAGEEETRKEAFELFPDISVGEQARGSGAVLLDGAITSYEALRDTIAAEMLTMDRSASGSGIQLTVSAEMFDLIDKAYYNAVYDYPEALFFAETGYKISYGVGDPVRVTLRPHYFTAAEMPSGEFSAAFDKALIECFGSSDPAVIRNNGMTDLEKFVAAHDWIVSNCFYDPYVSNGNSAYTAADGTRYDEDDAVYTPYGVFVNHKAVCQGYTLSLKALLNCAGVGCVYVNSLAMGHSWNMVQLGESWYHADVTWADPIYSGIGDYPGRVSREYFLDSDSEFLSGNRRSHYNWTTEYDTQCGSGYAVPALLADNVLPVFLCGGSLYLFSGEGLMYTLQPGANFTPGQAGGYDLGITSYDALGLDAAACDYIGGRFFLRGRDYSNYNEGIYCFDGTLRMIGETSPATSSGVGVSASGGKLYVFTLNDYSRVDNWVLDIPTPGALYGISSVSLGANDVTVGVTNYSGNGALLVAAVYNANGRMLRCGLRQVSLAAGSTGTFTLSMDTQGATRARAFLVSASTYMPLCAAKDSR